MISIMLAGLAQGVMTSHAASHARTPAELLVLQIEGQDGEMPEFPTTAEPVPYQLRVCCAASAR